MSHMYRENTVINSMYVSMHIVQFSCSVSGKKSGDYMQCYFSVWMESVSDYFNAAECAKDILVSVLSLFTSCVSRLQTPISHHGSEDGENPAHTVGSHQQASEM